jgi:hypothetical protein
VAGLLVHLVVLTAAIALVLQADRGERPSIVAALRVAVDRSGATVGGSVLLLATSLLAVVMVLPLGVVLAALPVLGAVLALGLGVVVLAVLAGTFALVVPVAVVEERGAWTTFRRVLWVVRGRFGRLVGTILVVLLAVVLVAFLVSIPVVLLTGWLGPPGWVADGLTTTLLTAVAVPVVAVSGLLVHHDARERSTPEQAASRRDPRPRSGPRG